MLHSNSQQLKIALVAGAGLLGTLLSGCGGDPSADAPVAPVTPPVSLKQTGALGAPQQVASAPPKDTSMPPGARPDPFRPWWDTRPKPPAVLSLMTPVRIAAEDTVIPAPPPGVEVQEMPTRRVAGILSGNGVYALLDNGQVVKPGDLTDDGYRVTTITSTAVTLKRTVGNQTYTQVVPLTDAGSTPVSQMSAPGGPGGAGRPFAPGIGGGGGRGRVGAGGEQ